MEACSMAYNFKIFCFYLFILYLAAGISSVGGNNIGVCYKVHTNNLLSPKEIVSMCKSNHITRMRIYQPNAALLETLRGSNIEVIVGIKNKDIQNLAVSYNSAHKWVMRYIKSYSSHIHFRYIAVGNEAIPGVYGCFVLQVMKHLHTALAKEDLSYIKVSTTVSTSIVSDYYPPSAGTFTERASEFMRPIVKHLSDTEAPLLANLYPYQLYVNYPKTFSLYYALLLTQRVVGTDNGQKYYNFFDAIIDAFHASLTKVGGSKVSVVVAETGWPSSGNSKAANPIYAQTYISAVAEHVLTNHGASGKIETYIYPMFNENNGSCTYDERYWNLFHPKKFYGSVYD